MRSPSRASRLSRGLALAIGGLGAGPALGQRLGQGPADDISVGRVVLVLFLCLGIAAAAAILLRLRMGQRPMVWHSPNGSRRLELCDRLRLPNQIDLAIVRCDGQELLVASSPQGLTVIRDAWEGQGATEERAP